jgi:hypothetical protein
MEDEDRGPSIAMLLWALWIIVVMGVFAVYIAHNALIPKDQGVCQYFWCSDAGSPSAAQATIEANPYNQEETRKAVMSSTQTAEPVIVTLGDVVIERYYRADTNNFIYICKQLIAFFNVGYVPVR